MKDVLKDLEAIVTADSIKDCGYWSDGTTYFSSLPIGKESFNALGSMAKTPWTMHADDDTKYTNLTIEYWADDDKNKIVYNLTSDSDECDVTEILKPYFDSIVLKFIKLNPNNGICENN